MVLPPPPPQIQTSIFSGEKKIGSPIRFQTNSTFYQSARTGGKLALPLPIHLLLMSFYRLMRMAAAFRPPGEIETSHLITPIIGNLRGAAVKRVCLSSV
jgi:hypothetical protein